MSYMFSKEDLKIDSAEDLINFLPVFIFCGLVAPFILAAYTVGALMDVVGWSDARDDSLGEY